MKRGFSYIETIIALAVFSIALLPLLPVLTQAHSNAFYSREAYTAQLHAQGIMAVARDAAIHGEDVNEGIEAYAADLINPPCAFGVWYGETAFISGDEALCVAPSAELDGLTGETITVVCWDEDGNISGRAVGIVPAEI